MGGQLFNAERINLEKYNRLCKEIIQKFSDLDIEVLIPDTFKEKTSFGDIDVVIRYEDHNHTPRVNLIKKLFNVDDDKININSSVLSILYDGVQIDFCHFPDEDFQSAFDYYRQSDCSNIVGVLAKYATGYRLTHRGLTYPVKLQDSDFLGEILVSKDRKDIYDFLDLEYEPWKNGFNNQEELFEWIMKSKYFNADCFKFDNLNHENKTRNRKRKVYSALVELLESKTFENSYIAPSDKQQHLFRGLLHFMHSTGFWIEQAEYMIEDRYHFLKGREAFSGADVMELTSLSGKELGDTIRLFEVDVLATYKATQELISRTERPSMVDNRKFLNWLYSTIGKTEMRRLFSDWYNSLDKPQR